MKKLIIMGILALSINQVSAQHWNGASNTTSAIDRQGNVGIGFPSGSPNYNLVVQHPTTGNGAKVLLGGNTLMGIPSPAAAGTILEMQSTENSIIGLTSHINSTDADVLWFGTNAGFHTIYCHAQGSLPGLPFTIIMEDNSTSTNTEAIRIWPNGQIGIGTGTTSLGTNTKLAVEGLIACRELKVLPTSTAWPDYVFAKDYERMSLDDVEAYIDENQHLPQLPSAAIVEKDGFKIGETQTQMLQALEELYLHVIDLKKQNEELRKEISSLKN